MVCDNTLVGVIARDSEGRILMIREHNYPFGYAPPAGHCDGNSYPVACFKEFEEKTGLNIVGAPRPLVLRNSKIGGPFGGCRRGGKYHHWQVFEVDWDGKGSLLSLSTDKVEWLGWKSVAEITALAQRTVDYVRRLRLAGIAEDQMLANAIRGSVEKDWQKNPGLGVTWFHIFEELRIF